MADRAQAWLSRLGLGHVGLDDRVGRLSGGEAVLTALAALFLRRPPVIVLDEPTNNLDLDARRRLYAAVESWPGVMLIVSHDRELLALMDQIAELTGRRAGRAGAPGPPGGSLRMYGGNLEAYEAQLATEQAAARRAVAVAEAGIRREKRDLMANQTKQARRDRQGRAVAASGSLPRIVAYARKRAAQETAGRSREIGLERVAAAEDAAGRGGRGSPRRRHDQDLAARNRGARRADRARPCAGLTGRGCRGGLLSRLAIPPRRRRLARLMSSSFAGQSGSRSPGRTARERPPCCAISPGSWTACLRG